MNQNRDPISSPELIEALRRYNLLPAIVFLPTRRLCDEAANDSTRETPQSEASNKQLKRRQIFDEFVEAYPEIRKHRHLRGLINAGIAAHHAGHMPPWKLLIEKMMTAGLLDAIFATSTVAAGVDFPARTVVISNADTRGKNGWNPLSASELQQMTGRAGRRGRDNVGFIVLAPGRFQNPKRIAELLRAKPDALESRFRATYTSLLNLLDAFGSFEQVRDIAARSFAYRNVTRGPELTNRIWMPFEQRARVLDHYGFLDLDSEKVTESGKWLADLRVDRPLLVGEAIRRGLFDGSQEHLAAGLIASVAADADRDFGPWRIPGHLGELLSRFEEIVYEVSGVEWKNGIVPEESINYSAAACAGLWAKGIAWIELAGQANAEEGDLIRLFSRTGEALRQVAALSSSNLAVAALARSAAASVLRPPLR